MPTSKTQGNKSNVKWAPSIIDPFPELAVVERTSFTVTNESVETITFRSTECLRLRSIKATYKNAIARCETSNNTIFEIHLFRGEGKTSVEQESSSTDEEDSILVEIQLRNGDCMEFRDEYMALREAVLNNNLPKVRTEEELMKDEERDPEEKLRAIFKDKYVPLPEGVVERNVQMVARRMTSSSMGDILFGLTELRSLTNVQSSSKKTALKSSKMIMMEDEFSIIKQKIIQIITSTPSEDAEEVHSLALTIFVNCLKALHRSNDLDSGVFQDLGNRVVPTLVKILNCAEDEPHLACLAAECISILLNSTRQGEIIETSAIKSALNHGKVVGMESYHNLERETMKALKKLPFEFRSNSHSTTFPFIRYISNIL